MHRWCISHWTRGIRISLLVLSIWGNYLSRWWQFHWNTTGITFGPKIDEQRSEYQFTHILEHYYSGLASVTFRTNRIFIISGNIGTNKDRWNIWTFGIKVYSTSRLLYNKHQILPVHKNFIENISLNKFLVTTKKLPSHQAASINELLVSSDNQGIRNWQIRCGSNNTPHYHRKFQNATNSLTAAVPLYCESRNYESHCKGIIWSYQEFTLNLMYLGTFRRKKQKPRILLNTTKKRTEVGKSARCESQQFSTTSCLTCREEAGDGVEMDLCHMAQHAASSNRRTIANYSLPLSLHTYWFVLFNNHNTFDFYQLIDDDFGILMPRSFTFNVLHTLRWSSNAKNAGFPPMHTDTRGAWLLGIYGYLFGFLVIRIGAHVLVRSLSGFPVLQWLCWGVLRDYPVGMQNRGRLFYVLLGSVFSSERAVPSTSSWHPFLTRSLINSTSRLCMHVVVTISTDCAHCLCLFPGLRYLYMMKLSSYTLLLYHTHISSPSMPSGIVCEGLCVRCAGGVHTIHMYMIVCLWRLIAHDLMITFASTLLLSYIHTASHTRPSGAVNGCWCGVRAGLVYTTSSYAVMWLAMIVLPSLMGGYSQDSILETDPMFWYNFLLGGLVQFFLGGPAQLFLGGSAQLFLGGPAQLFLGGLVHFLLGGHVQLSPGGLIHFLSKAAFVIAYPELKSVLSKIQSVYNLWSFIGRKIAFYQEQHYNDTAGEQKDTFTDRLQHMQLVLLERCSPIAELRIDALELADDDGVSLSAEQPRTHVR